MPPADKERPFPNGGGGLPTAPIRLKGVTHRVEGAAFPRRAWNEGKRAISPPAAMDSVTGFNASSSHGPIFGAPAALLTVYSRTNERDSEIAAYNKRSAQALRVDSP